MRLLYHIVCLAVIVITFSSCEKVIDLDLNSAEKKYVVEATMSDQSESVRVLISQTKDFDEDSNFPGISGATVTITERGGNSYTLTDGGTGLYYHGSLRAEPGKTYDLRVQLAGEVFTASSTAPQPVAIDSLYITDELLFGDYRKMANLRFRDPPGRGNCYRFVQYVNGIRETQIMIMNDDYIDDRLVTSTLYYFADEDDGDILIKPGDEVKVKFQVIDEPVYKYWFSLLRSSTGGNQQASPANPVSNMQGGALGYFSAHTETVATVIVP